MNGATTGGGPGPDSGADLPERLRLVVARLSRRLRKESGVDLTFPNLTFPQHSALASIDHHGAVTAGDLAAIECLQPPSVTRIAAFLEQAGLVARAVDPCDRRVVRMSVTPEGRRVLQRSRTARTAFLARRLATLSNGEQALLTAAVPVLERLVEGGK